MAPKTSRKELTRVEKGMILAFFEIFQKISTVSQVVGRPWSRVRNFLARSLKRGSIDNLPRSGRPPLLSERAKRSLVRGARVHRDWNREKLREILAPNVSLCTVDRALRESGIKKWLAKKRAKLTPEHAQKRLAWARAHQNWTAEDFEGVIWSDECSVERSRNPQQKWIFRSASEKWHPECIRGVGKGKGIALMVWGCFWGKNRGTFVPLVVKSVDRWVYLQWLEICLIPVLNRVRNTLGDPIFQQDNSTVHTAQAVLEWFEENGIELAEHPPCSPDLNPIEHVWVEMKKRLQIQYPDIASTPGGPQKVKEKLAEALPIVWDTIPSGFFEQLWRSMPDRVQAVIAAKGWYTRY